MKWLVASVAIVLVTLSTADAQQHSHEDSTPDMAGVIGSTIGALVGSTIGDGRGQPLATGIGALLGGLIGETLSQRRQAANRSHPLVQQLDDQRNQTLDAAVSGKIPMPRKATPVRRRQVLSACQELAPGTFACQSLP